MNYSGNLFVIWNKAMEELKLLSQESYAWFRKITPVQITDTNIMILGVPDTFFAEWCQNNYSTLLEQIFAHGEQKYTFKFVPGYQPAVRTTEEKITETHPEMPPVNPKSDVAALPVAQNQSAKVHTFENFVVGEENRYAYAAAKRVAEAPGDYHNPLYIYGGTGVGKTHLLQSVVYEIHQHNPRALIHYTSCEELLNDFVDSLRMKTGEFRNHIRNVDVLLIDDVHFLAKKNQLQEEFFNIFNTLKDRGKQILLTSDKQPCEIIGLEERLVSRFEDGLTTEILPPEYETRLAILKMLRDEPWTKVKLSDDVLRFIAENITTSVRRLKGAFIRISTYSSFHPGEPISHEVIERLLGAILAKESAAKVILVDDIQRTVSDYFGLKISDILSDKRPKNIAEPRMIAMYLSRKLTKLSLPEIGQSFGKNHATIMNAMKRVPVLCEKSEELKRNIAQIERQLHRN